MKNELHLWHSESSSPVTLLVLHADWMILKNASNQGRANSVTDASSAHEEIFKAFQIKVPGIASNIPRNKSALVMGICTTFTCFQTPLLRLTFYMYNRNKLEIYLPKRNSSNLYVQNVHVVATGEQSVFCCFD